MKTNMIGIGSAKYKIINHSGETVDTFQTRETSRYELEDLAEKILARELKPDEQVVACDINGL